ncbi:unnamed protein product [Urochloa decumbens]|uniref:Uncharacterized protein n=1 Tax=Urochloa decumbens TaxID=240449 RepID=A0ABC9C4W8_9POAL
MAALRSDDTEFYARAAVAWLLSASLAAAILRGWIRGHGFRARTWHLATLFYSTWLSRDTLKLHLAHGILPEYQRQCRGSGVTSVLAIGERILMHKAYLRVLTGVAVVCFFGGVAMGTAMEGAIYGKRMLAPPLSRPSVVVAGRRTPVGVGGILVEILLFIPCVLTANCGAAAGA